MSSYFPMIANLYYMGSFGIINSGVYLWCLWSEQCQLISIYGEQTLSALSSHCLFGLIFIVEIVSFCKTISAALKYLFFDLVVYQMWGQFSFAIAYFFKLELVNLELKFATKLIYPLIF